MADGTLRIQIDIHQTHSRAGLALLAEVGAAVVVARLKDSAPLTATEILNNPPDTSGIQRAQEAFLDPIVDKTAEILARQPKNLALTGELMQALYKSGWFHNPTVLAVLGEDARFLQWCRRHETCFHCDAPDTEDNPIQAAHYRKVSSGAGTSLKPPYSALPLCSNCHREQHSEGYSSLAPPDVWEKWVAKTRQDWGHQQMRDIFDGCESMTEVPIEWVLSWAGEHELMKYIPEGYRVPV